MTQKRRGTASSAALWCAWLSITFAGAAAAAPAEKTEVSAVVSADRLVVSHEKRTARFEGNVEATYRGARILCERLEVRYGDDGSASSFAAEGRVRISRGDIDARAQRVRLDARRFRLVLEGEPHVRKGPQTLRGRRVEIDLRSGEIDVLEAKGVFELKGLEKGR